MLMRTYKQLVKNKVTILSSKFSFFFFSSPPLLLYYYFVVVSYIILIIPPPASQQHAVMKFLYFFFFFSFYLLLPPPSSSNLRKRPFYITSAQACHQQLSKNFTEERDAQRNCLTTFLYLIFVFHATHNVKNKNVLLISMVCRC